MSRPRNRANDNKLPCCVYRRRDRNCYIYRKGKNKPLRLCSLDASISEVWAAYDNLNIDLSTNDTLRWMLDEYNSSSTNKKNPKSSQDQNHGYRKALVLYKGKTGKLFGDIPLNKIKRRMIRTYLVDAEHPIGANRQIQYLKAVWNWASQLYDKVPDTNPCQGVTFNKEKARTRYIEDWEYELVKEVILRTTRSHYLAVLMELAYLCRLRCSEARGLKITDIEFKEGHIKVIRKKGSMGELTHISPRVQTAIDDARRQCPNAPSPIAGGYLLHNAKGLAIGKNKFDSAWKRAMHSAKTVGLTVDGKTIKLEEHFTFHDIKAKGVSDHTEHESGHKSDKAKQVYIRRIQEVEATK